MVAILEIIKQAYSAVDSLAFDWYNARKAEQEEKRKAFLARNEYCMNALRNAKNNPNTIEFNKNSARNIEKYVAGVQNSLIKQQTNLISKLEQKITSAPETVIEESIAKLETVEAYHKNISLPFVEPINISSTIHSLSDCAQKTPESAKKYELTEDVKVAKEYVANSPSTQLSVLAQIAEYGVHVTTVGFATGIGALACASAVGFGLEVRTISDTAVSNLIGCGIATLVSVPVSLAGAHMTEFYQHSVSAVKSSNIVQAEARTELKLPALSVPAIPILAQSKDLYSLGQAAGKELKTSVAKASAGVLKVSSYIVNKAKNFSAFAVKYAPAIYLSRIFF